MSAGGRLEALARVPAGVTVRAVNNAHPAGVNVVLAAGSYTPTELCAQLAGQLNALAAPSSGAWAVALSTRPSGTGLVTVSCPGSWSLTWTTALLGELLGFAGNIATRTTPATAPSNARGLWLPKCHLLMDGDPATAPEVTDARATEGPTGVVIGLVGTSKRRHGKLAWRHVTRARTWEVHASPPRSSWQQWLRDTQWGRGHAWFAPCSGFRVYYDLAGVDAIVGAELHGGAGPTAGWKFSPAIAECNPRMASGQWLGLWSIETPAIVCTET